MEEHKDPDTAIHTKQFGQSQSWGSDKKSQELGSFVWAHIKTNGYLNSVLCPMRDEHKVSVDQWETSIVSEYYRGARAVQMGSSQSDSVIQTQHSAFPNIIGTKSHIVQRLSLNNKYT